MRNTVSLLIVPVLLAACAWLSRASSTAGGLGEPTPTPSVESIPNPAHTPTLQTSPGSRYAYQVFGVPGVTSPPICDFKKPFDIQIDTSKFQLSVVFTPANADSGTYQLSGHHNPDPPQTSETITENGTYTLAMTKDPSGPDAQLTLTYSSYSDCDVGTCFDHEDALDFWDLQADPKNGQCP